LHPKTKRAANRYELEDDEGRYPHRRKFNMLGGELVNISMPDLRSQPDSKDYAFDMMMLTSFRSRSNWQQVWQTPS
jgi:hypothetical protein